MFNEKRYGVFVSSTFRDLVDERRVVMQALLELDCIPTGMELFPESDDTSWKVIQRVIDDSDYYLLILAGRYGSLDSHGVAFTEREYDYAVSVGKPVISFLHSDPGSIPSKHSEADPELRGQLLRFRSKAEQKQCRYWSTAHELGIAVTTSYVRLIATHPAEGWVKARYAKSPDYGEKLASLLEQNRALERELASLRSTGRFDTSTLSSGTDSVTIEYRVGDELLSAVTDWNSLFRIVGSSCIDLKPESEIRRGVSEWIRSRLQAATDRPVELTDSSLQGIKIQFYCLGLIDTRTEDRPGRNVVVPVLVWALTQFGRETLAELMAAKKVSAGNAA